jgi:hypothetical protein
MDKKGINILAESMHNSAYCKTMGNISRQIAAFIGCGVVGLVGTLYTAALGAAGVVNVSTAYILLTVAWAVMVAGTFGAETLAAVPIKKRIIVTISVAVVSGVFLGATGYWMSSQNDIKQIKSLLVQGYHIRDSCGGIPSNDPMPTWMRTESDKWQEKTGDLIADKLGYQHVSKWHDAIFVIPKEAANTNGYLCASLALKVDALKQIIGTVYGTGDEVNWISLAVNGKVLTVLALSLLLVGILLFLILTKHIRWKVKNRLGHALEEAEQIYAQADSPETPERATKWLNSTYSIIQKYLGDGEAKLFMSQAGLSQSVSTKRYPIQIQLNWLMQRLVDLIKRL